MSARVNSAVNAAAFFVRESRRFYAPAPVTPLSHSYRGADLLVLPDRGARGEIPIALVSFT